MKLIILDIDGTMTLSEHHHQSAFLDGLNAVGIQEVNQDWASYKHITDTYIFKENYIAQFGVEPDEETYSLLEELIADNIQAFVPPKEVPGAKAFVEMLKNNADYAFAYATGSLYAPAKYKLDETGIFYTEDILIGSNGLESREEIVSSAIEAAKKHYQVDHFEKIISAGDGMWDLKTAQNLGLYFLGIGEKNEKAFTEENVKFYRKDWEEINVDYLNGVCKTNI